MGKQGYGKAGQIGRICCPGKPGRSRRWLAIGEGPRLITLQMGQTTLRPTARASSWDPLDFWFRSALRRCASIFCFPRVIPPPLPPPPSLRPPVASSLRRLDSDRRPPCPAPRVWMLLRLPRRTFLPGIGCQCHALPPSPLLGLHCIGLAGHWPPRRVWRGVKWRPIYYWPIWPIWVSIYTLPLMDWVLIFSDPKISNTPHQPI
jgi:hypothetical protein